jgi:hypothetical protein
MGRQPGPGPNGLISLIRLTGGPHAILQLRITRPRRVMQAMDFELRACSCTTPFSCSGNRRPDSKAPRSLRVPSSIGYLLGSIRHCLDRSRTMTGGGNASRRRRSRWTWCWRSRRAPTRAPSCAAPRRAGRCGAASRRTRPSTAASAFGTPPTASSARSCAATWS